MCDLFCHPRAGHMGEKINETVSDEITAKIGLGSPIYYFTRVPGDLVRLVVSWGSAH